YSIELQSTLLAERMLVDLETAVTRDAAVAAVQPDPWLRLAGLTQYADDLMQLETLRGQVAAKREYFDARVESSFLLRDQLRMQEQVSKEAITPLRWPDMRREA